MFRDAEHDSANFHDPPRIYVLCNSAVNITFCVPKRVYSVRRRFAIYMRRGLWQKRQSRARITDRGLVEWSTTKIIISFRVGQRDRSGGYPESAVQITGRYTWLV